MNPVGIDSNRVVKKDLTACPIQAKVLSPLDAGLFLLGIDSPKFYNLHKDIPNHLFTSKCIFKKHGDLMLTTCFGKKDNQDGRNRRKPLCRIGEEQDRGDRPQGEMTGR